MALHRGDTGEEEPDLGEGVTMKLQDVMETPDLDKLVEDAAPTPRSPAWIRAKNELRALKSRVNYLSHIENDDQRLSMSMGKMLRKVVDILDPEDRRGLGEGADRAAEMVMEKLRELRKENLELLQQVLELSRKIEAMGTKP